MHGIILIQAAHVLEAGDRIVALEVVEIDKSEHPVRVLCKYVKERRRTLANHEGPGGEPTGIDYLAMLQRQAG